MSRVLALPIALAFALALAGLSGCKDEVRVKLRVRAADAGVRTSTASPPR